ncbi:hypothetical protein VP01_3914g2 [Puccinia sorghi]|uniref:DDE Tnp4 domain-containing protein n=1 Tax=Puccinia sorghi TaxID=27349 RepID=A0A0L6UTG6_9BASI|nr:hypothetical protein VP01_3914g2 [Puccinia sorghi]
MQMDTIGPTLRRMISTLQDSIQNDIMNLGVTLALEDDSNSDEEKDEDYDETLEALDSIEVKPWTLFSILLQSYIATRKKIEKSHLSVTIYCTHLKINASRETPSQRANDDKLEETLLLWKLCFCWNFSHFFRLGEGTVELDTNRCLMAIVALKDRYHYPRRGGNDLELLLGYTLHTEGQSAHIASLFGVVYIMWPTEEECLEVQAQFEEVGFRGCVGVIYGSYGISTFWICNINKKIQYLYTGWTGYYFSGGQCLWADSAFSPTINIVPAFKKNDNSTLTDEQQSFSQHLSDISTFERPQIASNQRDLSRMTPWINVCACLVLHNFLLEGSDIEVVDSDECM